MKGIQRALLVVVTGVCLTGVDTRAAQVDDEASVVRVRGTAEVRVPPDRAVVRLGIVEQAPTARDAQEAVNRTAASILDAIGDLAVPASQVQTVRVQLSPIYATRSRDDDEPRIVAYRATNTVSVRVEETQLDLVGPVIDAGLDAGANQLEGVSFGLTDTEAAQRDALRQAVTEATAKATAIAEALGRPLGTIVSVAEEDGFVREPRMEMMGGVGGRAFQVEAPTPVSAGDVSVTASVALVYRLD